MMIFLPSWTVHDGGVEAARSGNLPFISSLDLWNRFTTECRAGSQASPVCGMPYYAA